jgi:hypothetical protein
VSGWLEPLRAALDEAPAPVTVFFRDDDAGWADARLMVLLELFGRHALPVDVAVIPAALTDRLAGELRERAAATGGLVVLHQHGLAHANHEAAGGKCEFGPSRSRDVQRADLERGRELLAERLDGVVEATFTPPWNRCTLTTAELLAELGFAVLSRDSAAPRAGVPGLREVPASVDWSYARHRDGSRLSFPQLAELAGDQVRAGQSVGVLFHHEVIDDAELALADELLRLLAGHETARCVALAAA